MPTGANMEMLVDEVERLTWNEDEDENEDPLQPPPLWGGLQTSRTTLHSTLSTLHSTL